MQEREKILHFTSYRNHFRVRMDFEVEICVCHVDFDELCRIPVQDLAHITYNDVLLSYNTVWYL